MKIKDILSEYPDNDNYGVERICIALRQRGIGVSRQTVYRAMKEAGLLHCRRIPHGITKATTEIQIVALEVMHFGKSFRLPGCCKVSAGQAIALIMPGWRVFHYAQEKEGIPRGRIQDDTRRD